MVTIKDIAEKAQTSIATVSRVMNDLGGYSEETREKVLKVAEEIGYESNAVARSLIVKKTQTIGIVFPNISSLLTYEFLNGIEEIAYKKGYSVIVTYTYSQPERMMKSLKTLNEKRVDGIIFTSDEVREEYLDYLKKLDIPTVFLSTKSDNTDIPFVKVNDYKAAYDATQFLINKGHNRIGMIAGNPNDKIAGIPRIDGYMQALKDANIEADDNLIKYGYNFNFEDGKKAFKELIETDKNLTAIFVASDEMAAGALSTALAMGIKVPEDLSIIGFDDTMISELVYPPLTTLSQPLMQMGSEAVTLLLKIINKENDISSMFLPHSISERKSVKKYKI